MVVVGHSQGGLLTKISVVNSGDSLVRALTGKAFDALDLTAEKKAQVRRLMVIEPVSSVKRVVFISTPHRGSILSKQWVRNLIRKIVTLPEKIAKTTLSLNAYSTDDVKRMIGSGQVPTSIDGMSSDNPMLKALAEIPLATGVTGHSIIAIKGDDEPPAGDDGVVTYTSAHLDGMQSEFIVRSGHSCQENPFTIEEVRTHSPRTSWDAGPGVGKTDHYRILARGFSGGGVHQLPVGQQQNRVGCIIDGESFARVWKRFMPDETVPPVDFSSHLVLFNRNVTYYNRTNIVRVTRTQGVVDILATETRSAIPVDTKVAMAMVVDPRPGIKGIRLDESTTLPVD